MKWFIIFIGGIIATFALISFATGTGDGESPLEAIGVPQGNSTARIIYNGSTPLPTRSILSFTGQVSCSDAAPQTVCDVPNNAAQDSIFHPVGMTNTVTGSGSTTTIARQWSVNTGATAGSTALSRNSSVTGWGKGSPGSVINWSNHIRWTLQFTINPVTTNGIVRFSMGKTTTAGIGDCATRCIGFKVANTVVSLMTHNGTTLTDTPFIGVLNADTTYRIIIDSDGSGTCSATLIGAVTTEIVSNNTTCPVGLGTGGQTVVQIEAENGADAVTTVLYMHLAAYEIYD